MDTQYYILIPLLSLAHLHLSSIILRVAHFFFLLSHSHSHDLALAFSSSFWASQTDLIHFHTSFLGPAFV